MLRALLEGNHRYWDDYLPHIEFAYNRVVHKTTKMSPFEVVYGFNRLTPSDLIPLQTFTSFYIKMGFQKLNLFKNCMRGLKVKYNNKVIDMPNKIIGRREIWFLKKGIRFGFIYTKIVFLQKESLNSNPGEMGLFKSSSVSTTMHI